jgi:hypothetical protein
MFGMNILLPYPQHSDWSDCKALLKPEIPQQIGISDFITKTTYSKVTMAANVVVPSKNNYF